MKGYIPILVGLSLLIGEGVVSGEGASIEVPKYALFYEFHRDYVKMSHISTGPPGVEDTYMPVIGTPSLYEVDDIYEIEVSPNAVIKEDIVSEDFWRGVIYKHHTFIVHLKEGNTYTLSYKSKVLPHLHTRKSISPNVEYHLGVNMAPYPSAMGVFAFPPGTEIKEVFNSLPTKTINYEGWELLVYDRSFISQNIGAHVRFVLPDKEVDELDIIKVFQEILKIMEVGQ